MLRLVDSRDDAPPLVPDSDRKTENWPDFRAPCGSRPPRLALVSYECHGALAGGIGTWVRSTAAMMAGRGYMVDVFAAKQPEMAPSLGGARLHLVEATRATFPRAVAEAFGAVHSARPFDLVEGREYGGDLAGIAAEFPEVPRVVKLATAAFIIEDINRRSLTAAQKLRFLAGALRRGRSAQPYWRMPAPERPGERETTLGAHAVTSPSGALIRETARRWPIDTGRTVVIPHAFVPPASLLAMDPDSETQRVVFLGRLEVRKGVLEFAAAIPRILRAFPEARFRFVGRSLPLPGSGRDIAEVIRARLGRHAARAEFTGGLDHAAAMDALGDADIVVLPSHFEAFGFVSLEAMAAARGVVASSAGGMAEIVEDGRTGLLVPPKSPAAIARAVAGLLADPDRRRAMGRAARERVLTAYAPEVIAPMQEALYARVAERAGQAAAAAL